MVLNFRSSCCSLPGAGAFTTVPSFGSATDQTQGSLHTTQVLYQLSSISSLRFMGIETINNFSRVYGLSSFHEMNHDNIIVYKIAHFLGARLLLTSQPAYFFQRKLILYQDLSETRRQSTKFSSGNICQTVWPPKQLVCVPGSQADSLWVLPSCLFPEDSQPSFSWVSNVCSVITSMSYLYSPYQKALEQSWILGIFHLLPLIMKCLQKVSPSIWLPLESGGKRRLLPSPHPHPM